MNKWRFAFSRRWFGYLAVAVVFAVVCVFLSNWQLSRSKEKQAEIALVTSNWDAEPVAIDVLLPKLGSFDDADRYRPVTVTGNYLVEEQVLVRNRPRSGNPGFEVITPLELSDGTVFMVDRGWLPTGEKQDLPDVIPAPPTGTVTVTARLKAGEPHLPGRSAADGQIATIQLEDLQKQVGAKAFVGAYGLLISESPEPKDARPLAALKPEIDQGMHLSYALQWIVFALLGFAFLAYAIRQEYRMVNAEDPEEQKRAEVRERKRRRRRTDADIEDEILDSVG